MTDRARRIRNRLVAAVAVLVLLNVALAAANELLPSGRIDGDAGSSFVTTPAGSAAWFELLRRTGLQPERLTSPMSDSDLDLSVTLVIADVWYADGPSVEAVRDFVRKGGRAVVATPEGWVGDVADALLDSRPAELASPLSSTFVPTGSDLAVRGVSVVESAGVQVWAAAPESEQILVNDTGEALAVTYPLGEGTVVLVADSSVFSNEYLDEADNAAFAVAVLGDRPAVFDEYSHGYIDDLVTEPLLPRSWRWTLYLLAAATVVFLIAAGRRLGPPERATRRLPPPRRWFIESLATTLGRTDLTEATEPLRLETLRRLLTKTGLGADASPEDIMSAGVALGISGSDLQALLRPAENQEDAMAVARVISALSRRTGSGTPVDHALAIVPSRSSEEGHP